MARLQTNTLSDNALDWAMATAQSMEVILHDGRVKTAIPNITERHPERGVGYSVYSPSTSWSKAGPIIDRFKLCLGYKHQGDPDYCEALDPDTIAWARTTAGGHLSYGETPLVAAMRCIAVMHFGPEIDVPDEFLEHA